MTATTTGPRPIASAHRRRARRGLVSAVALVTLLVVGLIGFALLRVAVARRGAVRAEERRLQASALAESALDRAAARLAADPAYAGETWEIPAGDLGGRGTARVVIRVGPAADAPGRLISVQADYPADSTLRARRSRSLVVAAPMPDRNPPNPTAEVPRP